MARHARRRPAHSPGPRRLAKVRRWHRPALAPIRLPDAAVASHQRWLPTIDEGQAACSESAALHHPRRCMSRSAFLLLLPAGAVYGDPYVRGFDGTTRTYAGKLGQTINVSWTVKCGLWEL